MINIIKRAIDFDLSPQEASDIRSQISDIQGQILSLNKKTEDLFHKLINEKISREVDIVVETTNETITEYYDGQVISVRPNPEALTKAEMPKIQESQPTAIAHEEYSTSSSPLEEGEVDLFLPEKIDPDYEEELDLF